ncbi:GNAT family N-acetyltransferase [Streptomyces atratus]|uniref:GNAT family N-acetyltransferase n=1 Tax=Streptomyces atratus TaxID=1893 RepID=UPI0033C73FD1
MDRNRARPASADAYEEESTADRAWVERYLADVPGSGSVRYGVRRDGVLIGRVDPVAAAPARYAIECWPDAAHTGRGAATVAGRAAVAHTRDVRGVDDVYASVVHGNAPGVAVLNRLGSRGRQRPADAVCSSCGSARRPRRFPYRAAARASCRWTMPPAGRRRTRRRAAGHPHAGPGVRSAVRRQGRA